MTTTNGGVQWHTQTLGPSHTLFDASFADADHGSAGGELGTIVVFQNTVPGGRLIASPPSGPVGTVISVTSDTPCPSGSSFATSYLINSAGTTVASSPAVGFGSGGWAATLTVPNAIPGRYFVSGNCYALSTKHDTQDYNFIPFSVTGTAAR